MASVSKKIVQELENKYLNNELDITEFPLSPYDTSIEQVIYAFATLRDRTLTLSEVFDKFDELDADYTGFSGLRYTRAIYKVWVDLEGVKNREDNILTKERSNPADWQVDYNKSLSKFVFEEGYPVPFLEDNFSRHDYDFNKSLLKDPIGFFNIKEEYWSEFAGTFVDNENFVGVTVDVVSSTGVSQKIRVNKSLSEIIREITK